MILVKYQKNDHKIRVKGTKSLQRNVLTKYSEF